MSVTAIADLFAAGMLPGLRFGIPAPTGISVLAVVHALGMGVFLYRDMTWVRFQDNLPHAGMATGVVMLAIMGSAASGWVTETIPILITGMPLDLLPATRPPGEILVPLTAFIDIDPVPLGLMPVLNLPVGPYTPLIGTTPSTSAAIARTSPGATTRELRALLMSMIVPALVSHVPALSIH